MNQINKEHILAIVIPVYKATFLKKTLESIANQTCLNFHVYIGNDKSPYNISDIVQDYIHKIPITYKEFDKNIGGESLISHWNRCIDLIQNEEWIWLFSDDDIMSPTCIENFYIELEKNKTTELFHFNVNIINEKDEIIKTTNFPNFISITNFNIRKLKGNISSYVVDYIFNRKKFEQVNRFQEFDMAWGSDDATWTKIGFENGIKTIPNSTVLWRQSNENISPNNTNKSIVTRKISANIEFIIWLLLFYKKNSMPRFFLYISLTTWYLTSIKKYTNCLSKKELYKSIYKYFKITKTLFLLPLGYIYYLIK